MINNSELLSEYYLHLQHTERERNKYLQIVTTLSGAGILGAEHYLENYPLKKTFFYIFMMLASYFSYIIMKKDRVVVRGYSCYIENILKSNENNVFKYTSINSVSKSKQYESFTKVLIFFYGIMGFYNLLIRQNFYQYNLLMALLIGVGVGVISSYTCRNNNIKQNTKIDGENKIKINQAFWKRVSQWWLLGGFFGVQTAVSNLLLQAASMHNLQGASFFFLFSFVFAIIMSGFERFSPELQSIARELMGDPQ